MKFDLDQAWRDTTQMIGKNANLLMIIAGVFFFLPSAALMIAFPELSQPNPNANPEDLRAMFAPIVAVYKQYWWAFLISGLIQTTGTLVVIALLRQRPQLTVGQAIQAGAKALPIYIAAQLLLMLSFFVLGMIVGAIGGLTASPAATVLLMVVLFVFMIYVYTKASLVVPAILVENKTNPIIALQRSWRLTKGNSLRLFGFYFLIGVVTTIALVIITFILGLALAFGGESVALFGGAVTSSIINAVMFTVLSAVIAAAHRQLAGPNKPDTRQEVAALDTTGRWKNPDE